MSRIPEQIIDRLKREIAVERVVTASGVKLSPCGKDLHGVCPLHDDTEPSLVVTPAKSLWRCFGCDQGGSVIDWVMASEGRSFRAAVEQLVAEYLPDVQLGPSSADPEATAEPFTEEEVSLWLEASDEEALSLAAHYYRDRMTVDPRGPEYLVSRGLEHPDLVDRFVIGIADRTLGQRLPAKAWKAGGEIREKLQRVGVLRSSGHEHLAGSLVVPIRDLDGKVRQLYGRKVTPNLRKGTPLHLYLPGPRDCVFHPEALIEHDELILTESILDALTFWCSGFRNVTCAFGTNGFTKSLHQAMLAHGTRRVLIAYDRDETGEKAAKKTAEKLLADGIECYRVLFPKGMDANEYARSVQPAPRSLDLVLRKASWMGVGRPPSQGVPELPAPEEEPKKAAKEEAALPSLAASPSPPSSASVLPAAPKLEIPTEVKDQEVVITLGDRRYRVRGLDKNLSYDALKVNLLAGRGDGFHVDTFDLYSDRPRRGFIKQAAIEMAVEADVVKHDLGKVLLKLEELQDLQIKKTLEPTEKRVILSDREREDALGLLRDPRLVERILVDFERTGVVGEETNKLMGYLASTSRLLDRPLAVVVQSSSAAGKSSLMEAILSLMPSERQVKYSAMTGQSLFYMGETNLSHKILAIVEEEGAERASYALKLLQSEGELTIASTGKDPTSGRLVTHEYRVEGPVMIFLTTTAIDIDEELLNRCLVLSVDEAREQTRAIHRQQRERRTLEGLTAGKEREAIVMLHQNAQRLLRPLAVVNPYATELTFLDTQIRTRRDHEKYLTLIDSIALLHQHQREVKRVEVSGRELEYVEVELSDIELANRLAHEVLGRSLDELPSQTRRLLEKLDGLVTAGCGRLDMERTHFRFTRRQVRESLGWSYEQVRVHLDRLVKLEYVLVHQGGRGQSFVYELLYEGGGCDGVPVLPGLIDSRSLGMTGSLGSSATSLGPENGEFGAPLWGHTGPIVPPLGSDVSSAESAVSSQNGTLRPENAHLEPKVLGSSQSKIRRSDRAKTHPTAALSAAP
jgi:DNA primase catalytic core